MNYGGVLKQLVKLSGLNQKGFAKKHGLEETVLSRQINNKMQIRTNTLVEIAFKEGYTIKSFYELTKIE